MAERAQVDPFFPTKLRLAQRIAMEFLKKFLSLLPAPQHLAPAIASCDFRFHRAGLSRSGPLA